MNKSLIVICLSALIILFGRCGSQSGRDKVAKGNVRYGDTLSFFTASAIGDLFPLYSNDIYSHRVGSQVFETLLKLNPDNSHIVLNLVKKIETSSDNKTIKLSLRDDVFFHEDPCFQNKSNKMTAFDVKFSLDFACSNNPINNSGTVLSEKINGGEDCYKASKNKGPQSVSGIKVIDDYSLEISLKEPYVNFQKLLTSPSYGIFSKHAFDYYGKEIIKHPIGTGPFIMGKRTKENILLRYNPKYWKNDEFGNKLPYLNAIIIRNGNSKKEEFQLFRKTKCDVVFEVPSESLGYLLGSVQDAQKGATVMHRVLVSPGTSVSNIAFNLKKGPFTDVNLRKAVDYVINRLELCNNVLNGDGTPSNKGFAPPSQYYNNTKISEREYNIPEAIRLLKIYQKSKGPVPAIKFFITGGKESNAYLWGTYICESLKKHLGITTEIVTGSFTDREKAIANNEVDAWNVGWVADYPDPEGYFGLFYVKNKSSYSSLKNLFPLLSSNQYNGYYYLATLEKNNDKRNDLFNKCDSIIKSEAVLLPILIDDFVAIINLRVRNFKLSSLGIVDFTDVYIKEIE